MAESLYRAFVLRSPMVWRQVFEFVKANAQAFIDRGEPLRIVVTSEEQKRTAEQNRFYFGPVLRQIAEQAWVDGHQFSTEAWHEYLAEKFCPRVEFVLPKGEVRSRRKSTSEMTVKEFADYVTVVQAHAANEMGIEFDG